jgi:hypothetical protein
VNREKNLLVPGRNHDEAEASRALGNDTNESSRSETVSPLGLHEQHEGLVETPFNGEGYIPESWREQLARQAGQPMIMSVEFEREVAGCAPLKSPAWLVTCMLVAFVLGVICGNALAK